MLGYLAGAIKGDGSVGHYDYSGGRRVDTQHRSRLAVKDKEFLDVVQRYLKSLGCETHIGSVNCALINRAVQTYKKEEVEKIESLIERDASTKTYKAGFLGGIFDAEGSFETRGTCLRIANYNDRILREVGDYLKDFNFSFRREEKDVRLLGGLPEVIRFFSLTRPKIQRKKTGVFGSALKQNGGEIQDIISVGKKRVFNLETSTKTFIANGFVSHNCYARFMLKYHRREEKWGEFVDVKINAPQVLSRQLPGLRRGLTWLSSVTDPYQAVEEEYRLTRKTLQRLLPYQFPITVLTKSKLVTRDVDVFRQFKECEVGMTIITLDEIVRQRFEPNSSTIADRLNALKTLHESGIRTYAFIGPLLPFISEETIDELAAQLKEISVDRVLVDRLNIKGGNWQSIQETLRRHYPELIPSFSEVVYSENNYYSDLKKRVANILRKRGLEFSFCY